MSLRLTLKPNERVIIGGAVVRNGRGRVELLIDNEVPVLRESDIIKPEAVHTPCERIYFSVQLLYVDAERSEQHLDTYRTLAEQVLAAAPSCAPWLALIDEHVSSGRCYQALKTARMLMKHERELISHVQ